MAQLGLSVTYSCLVFMLVLCFSIGSARRTPLNVAVDDGPKHAHNPSVTKLNNGTENGTGTWTGIETGTGVGNGTGAHLVHVNGSSEPDTGGVPWGFVIGFGNASRTSPGGSNMGLGSGGSPVSTTRAPGNVSHTSPGGSNTGLGVGIGSVIVPGELSNTSRTSPERFNMGLSAGGIYVLSVELGNGTKLNKHTDVNVGPKYSAAPILTNLNNGTEANLVHNNSSGGSSPSIGAELGFGIDQGNASRTSPRESNHSIRDGERIGIGPRNASGTSPGVYGIGGTGTGIVIGGGGSFTDPPTVPAVGIVTTPVIISFPPPPCPGLGHGDEQVNKGIATPPKKTLERPLPPALAVHSVAATNPSMVNPTAAAETLYEGPTPGENGGPKQATTGP